MISGRRRVRLRRIVARRELTLVVFFGVVTMLLVAVGAIFASRSVAQRQALDEAERSTQRMASVVMVPLLPGYLAGRPEQTEDLNQYIDDRMSDGYLTEVTVWRADGTIVYADDPSLVNDRVSPPVEVGRAISGRTSSKFEDEEPEANAAGSPTPAPASGRRRFVEVYVPLQLPGQEVLAFEAYYNYERVDEVADQLLKQTLPLVLVPLLLLQLIQIPAAASLARRLKRHEVERARLLERALSASERERVRFAADLHDGPIQDLAGIGYALGAVAPGLPERQAPLMGRVQDALQRAIESLRTLMTDLYPPDLRSGSLSETLPALTESLRADGVEVRLDIAALPSLGEETKATIYRVVRESMVNIAKHAQASTVVISLAPVEGRRGAEGSVRLVVEDDGVGLDPSRRDRRQEGHLGLRLLSDRVETMGGRFDLTSAPGEGTRLEVDLPLLSENDRQAD